MINDLKPNFAHVPTALSINLIRNRGIRYQETLTALHEERVLANLSGGSGAHTLLLSRDQGLNVVRKYCQSESNSSMTEKLKYQKDWYFFACQLLVKSMVPRILADNFSSPYDNFKFFDSEFIPGLRRLSDLYKESPQKVIRELTIVFGELYEKTAVKSSINQFQETLVRVFRLSCLKSIDEFLVKLGLVPNSYVTVNGVSSYSFDALRSFCSTFDSSVLIPKKNDSDVFSYSKTLIHGDPTLENLMWCEDSNKVVLLDPVGSLIDPGFKYDYDLGKGFPVFDFARLALSIELSYESWHQLGNRYFKKYKSAHEFAIEVDEQVYEFFKPGALLGSELDLLFRRFPGDLDAVVFSTLLRLLRYKTTDPEQVPVLLFLIDKYFKTLRGR